MSKKNMFYEVMMTIDNKNHDLSPNIMKSCFQVAYEEAGWSVKVSCMSWKQAVTHVAQMLSNRIHRLQSPLLKSITYSI